MLNDLLKNKKEDLKFYRILIISKSKSKRRGIKDEEYTNGN
jgi:hypothetical protein